MLVAATCLYVLRSPSRITAPALWAEDGTVFFKDAIESGFSALLAPHFGQLVILPRAIAAIVAPLPASMQPTLYAAAAVAVAVLSCLIVLSSRWRDPVPLIARFACLVALLCVPGVGETYGTLTNTHWWLGIGLLLLGMLSDPQTRKVRTGEVVLAALAGTSGFAALYGIPALGVRALRNKSRHSLVVLGIALLGVVIQVGILLGSTRRGDIGAILADSATGVLVLAKRVVATAALGDSNLAVLWPLESPTALASLVAIVVATALVLIWTRAARMEVGAFLLTLLGGWLLGLWALSVSSLDVLLWPAAAARYFLVPKAVLYVSLLASWPFGGVWRAVSVLLGVLLLTGILADYHLARSPTVDWTPFAQCVDLTRGDCTIEIPPGWSLQVEGRGP
jgi:hypothetical protein